MNKFHLFSGLHGGRVLTVYEREKVLMHVPQQVLDFQAENVTRKVKVK